MKFAVTIFSLIVFISCFGMFDNGSDDIVDGYEVGWIDMHETRSLYKELQIVPAYVFAVGFNSRFLFVKQHPVFTDSSKRIDERTINYFIVERTKNKYQSKPDFGPLTKEQFDSTCKALQILDPQFSHTYPTQF
jgi:hypothetical protein